MGAKIVKKTLWRRCLSVMAWARRSITQCDYRAIIQRHYVDADAPVEPHRHQDYVRAEPELPLPVILGLDPWICIRAKHRGN